MRRAESSRNVDERCDSLFVREGGDDAIDAEFDGDDETTTEATNRSGCSGVSSGSRRDVPFVDMGVYTRNRAFRLYLSSKFGKKTRLLPTRRLWRARDASRPKTQKTQPDETTFYKSLVCNVDPKVRLVSYEGVGQSGAYVGRVLTGYGDEPAASRRGASAGLPSRRPDSPGTCLVRTRPRSCVAISTGGHRPGASARRFVRGPRTRTPGR